MTAELREPRTTEEESSKKQPTKEGIATRIKLGTPAGNKETTPKLTEGELAGCQDGPQVIQNAVKPDATKRGYT